MKEDQMKKGKMLFSFVVFIALVGSQALANGLNLNSLGTKALTMGGAFVGLADDFSALYWNPAGIAQFDKRYFGFYGTDIIPSGTYTYGLVDGKTETKHYLAGMAAYFYPVSENVVAGIGIYIPSGLGNKWDGADFALIANNNPNLEWRSKIGLVTIAPALAYKINEQVSVGVALNINYGIFNIAMHAGSAEIPIPPYAIDLGQYEESMKGWGYGATFGVLFKPNETFSMGATLRTPSKVKFDGDASISNLAVLGINTTSDLEREVTWPMWLAGGVAYRPTENITVTGDIQWTQWSKIEVIGTDYKDISWQILMAASGDDERPMHWSDAVQIRFGAEYRMNTIAIRGGYYWDPSPTPDRTMNVLLPNYDFNVFTLGFGYELNGLQVDLGIEYLIGSDRNIPFEKVLIDPEWETAMPGLHTMNIVVPNVSISYKF
jgi:long-chain fatty acid transport protein